MKYLTLSLMQVSNNQKALLEDYTANKPNICGTIPSVANTNPGKEKLSCLFSVLEFQEASKVSIN